MAINDRSPGEGQNSRADDPTSPGRLVIAPIIGVSIVGTFLILLLGVLYYARSFVLPIVLALLLSLTLAPIVRRLDRWGFPPVVASVSVVVGVGITVASLTIALSAPMSEVMKDAPHLVKEVRARIAVLAHPFSEIGEATKQVEAIANGTQDEPGQKTVVIKQPHLISWIGGTLADLGTILSTTLLLTPFLLAARIPIRRKLVRILPSLRSRKVSLQVLNDIENEISRYLFTVTAINAALGTAVGTGMALLGMPNPLIWGVGTALLNYVPYAGSLIGIFLSFAVALVTFDSLAAAIIPPLVYFVLQLIEGSLVTPMIVGRRLEINAVAILVTLALTTWMWGVIGAIIGVPILVVIKVFCDHLPSLEMIGVLLSADLPRIEEDRVERRAA